MDSRTKHHISTLYAESIVLSIDADETDEVELQNAMANVVTYSVPFGATVSEYTNYSSSNSK